MSFFTDWKAAQDHAQESANAIGIAHGVYASNEYGRRGFSVMLLPKPENCYGVAARCYRVEPDSQLGAFQHVIVRRAIDGGAS